MQMMTRIIFIATAKVWTLGCQSFFFFLFFFFSAWKRCGMIFEIACEHSLMISFSARAFFFFSPAGKFDSLSNESRREVWNGSSTDTRPLPDPL